MAIKMYAIFSREGVSKMQGNKGKMCAQAGHAYLHAWWDAESLLEEFNVVEGLNSEADRLRATMLEYRDRDDARKIALLVDTDEELIQLYEDYKEFTGTTKVIDCGYTVVEPDTMTCIGIGPLRDEEKGGDLRGCELFIS